MLRAACTALRIEATAEDKLNLICYVSYDSYGHFSPLLFVHLPLPVRFLFVCLSASLKSCVVITVSLVVSF